MGLGKGNYFMKKPTKFGRVLAMLLTVSMMLSMIPASVSAATGDVVAVDTGLTGNIDTTATISLPIKIMDYQADGMLFEYGESNAPKTAGNFGATWSANFTGKGNYWNDVSPSEWLNYNSCTSGSIITTNSYAHFLRATYAKNSTVAAHSWAGSRAGVISPNDLGGKAMDNVRYLVMVYRSNVTSGNIAFFVERTGADRNNTNNRMVNMPFTSEGPTNWTYAVYDLKQGNLAKTWGSYGGANAVWTTLPIDASGEYMDIAHIALFASEEQAHKFGAYALTDGSNRGDNRGFGLLRSSRNENGSDAYAGILDKTTTVEQLFTYGSTSPADFSTLNTLGYKLLGTFKEKGIANVGLLESSLGPNGYPVYKQEVVAYLAGLLQHSLEIPERTADGWKNYRYIKGEPSDVYGGTDLATALRTRINKNLGSYAEASSKNLIGTWEQVQGNISSYYDAAYFLLNSIFIPDSYNVPQHDYNYLVLSKGIDAESGDVVHVFDAGFVNTTSPTATTPPAISYDTNYQRIQNTSAESKAHFYYQSDAATTLNPFLPITAHNNAEGQTHSVYYQDDGVVSTDTTRNTLRNRDFGYVVTSSGEFVYHADDELFFDFEGDDDVYLFINGELVMDIGSAHSIDKVRIELNDYVQAAQAGTLGSAQRNAALNLEEGMTYSFDFFYMERHSYGANMRINTNIHVTDPSMKTVKTAYQNGSEVNYGGVIDKDAPIEYAFSVTNSGNQRVFNLTFTDNDIGVTLDPNRGLVITNSNVCDVNGGTLDVTDLVAYVDGYSDYNEAIIQNRPPVNRTETIEVHFQNNDELMAFLKTLDAEYTDSSAGKDGLWPFATVQIRGIGYKLTKAQAEAARFDNVVFTQGNTLPDGTGTTLLGQDNMLVFVPSDPMFYQWSGHELVVSKDKLIGDVIEAAQAAGNPLEGKVPNLTANNVNSITLTTRAGNPIQSTNVKVNSDSSLSINYTKTGSAVFYVKIAYNSNNNSVVVPVLVNVTDVEDSVFVLDYGLNVNLTDAGGLTKNDTLTVPGRDTSWSLMGIGSNGAYANNKISFSVDTDGALRVDKGNGVYTLREQVLSYKPDDFMDQIESVQVAMNVYEQGITPSAVAAALNINKEVQMFKNVSVLPATVVYYEDNFPAIHYLTADENGINEIPNTFEPVQTNDYYTNANQSVDQDQAYGQDDLYKDLANNEFSGGSYHKITINNANNFASFEFKGTGFELISRTESQGYATLIVTVVDNATGKDVARIPVITEFDNTTNATDDSIFQVPVIRKDDLPYGTYTVYINGAPDYDFDNPNPDGSFNPIASYFYLDGLRIFQPMGSTNENYNDKENGATFAEIRDLIIAGTAAAAKYDGTSVTVSTTTTTWTENYLGVDTEYDEDGAVTYEGNRVDSVEDYLILGPNNEVYMNGDLEDAALIFYVKKQAGAKANELQIAVRAIDYQKFHGVTDSTQALSAEILYGVKSGAEFAWSPLVTVRSSTEQYYSVDLTNCPVDADGRIQVAVKVNSGMASFTSLKYNGLDLVSVGGDSTTLRYENGMLVGVAEDGSTSDAVVNAVEYPAFRMLSRQMRASTLSLDPEPSVPEETVPDVTEPEATEPEVTEPDVTEPDVTEPEATEPEATEPDATEPEATEPEATEPEVTEPEETEPEEPEEPEEDPRERLWKSLMETIEFLFKLLKGRGGH